MIESIHFLLTYQCNYECEHCFVFGSPKAEGTFTLDQLNVVFDEIKKCRTIQSVYFEGGEPFLFYPLLLEASRIAHGLGLGIGIVSNAYWATSEKDAELWLKPFLGLGIIDLSVSSDTFHSEEYNAEKENFAVTAARNLGIPVGAICIERPEVGVDDSPDRSKGEPIVSGGVRFRGRAVEKLTAGLPLRDAQEYTSCPYEDLMYPMRVHVDVYGNVSVCQGISIGNMWQRPLSEIITSYSWKGHPVCRPLVEGGPFRLAGEYNAEIEPGYVDACHLCFQTRKQLIGRFPDQLAPQQTYSV